jgi:hypothetical protein
MLRDANELAVDLFGRGNADALSAAPPVGIFGGSDSHSLRRIGTTYTEAEGRTREDFLRNLRAGRTAVGGRHGTMWDITAEIYGVIGSYWLSLLGYQRHDLSLARRALGIGWSIASLPFDFIPLAAAAAMKRSEARHIERCRRQLAERSRGPRSVALPELES